MKKKFNQNIIFLFISFLLSACCSNSPQVSVSDNPEVTIPESLGRNVVLATGIDFQTGKTVVINPKTGDEIIPCSVQPLIVPSQSGSISTWGNQRYNKYKSQLNGQQGCNVQIVNPNQELINAFDSSQKIISGTIRKDGVDIPARFVITLAALYEGSNCITLITNGGQYQSCTTLREDCNWLLPLRRYGNAISEATRKNVRKACGEQPKNGEPRASSIPQWKKDWRVADCNNLRTVYKNTPAIPAVIRASDGKILEPAMTYPAGYRQYIWSTCNNVTPPSWGAAPPP